MNVLAAEVVLADGSIIQVRPLLCPCLRQSLSVCSIPSLALPIMSGVKRALFLQIAEYFRVRKSLFPILKTCPYSPV